MIKPGNPVHRIKYTSYTDLPVIFFPKLCLHRDSILLFFFRATPMAYGSFQARSQIGAASAGQYHSHSNARSEPCLRPTLQLTATLDL